MSEQEQMVACKRHPRFAVALEAAKIAARKEMALVEEDFASRFYLVYAPSATLDDNYKGVLVFGAAKSAAQPYFSGEAYPATTFAGWIAQAAEAAVTKGAFPIK